MKPFSSSQLVVRFLGGDALPLAQTLRRMVIACGVMSALMLSVVMVAMGYHAADKHIDTETEEVLPVLLAALQAPLRQRDIAALKAAVDRQMQRDDLERVWIWDAQGTLLLEQGSESHPGRPGHEGHQGHDSEASHPFHADDNHWLPPLHGNLDVAAAVKDADGRLLGQVGLRLSLAEYRATLVMRGLLLMATLVASVLLASAWATPLARRISRPVRALADAADAVTRDMDNGLPPVLGVPKVVEEGADEGRRAARAFNHMIDALRENEHKLAQTHRILESRVRERTEELAAVKDAAVAASQAKTRFLAAMSHELRTPLNGVIGAAQLIDRQGDDPARREELSRVIRESGHHLLALIDNVLDLARVESGALNLADEPFLLADAIESTAASAAASVAHKDLTVSCIIDPRLPDWCRGDVNRVRQVLLNLLGNAVKFTLKGDVVLEARLHHGERGPVFKASVSDTGVGMSNATLAVLFEPFRQGEEGSARRFAGSGLGLAICRELVQAMGGRIEVRSTEGRGSIFDVEWPLRPVTEGPMNPSSKAGEPLGRVLIVDPHEPSALGLTALLARMGYSAVRCRTAAQLRSALAGRDAHGRSPWVMAATDDMGSLSILEQATTALNPSRMIGIHRSQALDAQQRGEAEEGTHNPLRLKRTLTRPVLRATLTALLDADLPNESTDDSPPESPSMHTDLQDPALLRSKAQHRGQVLLAEDDRTNQLIVRAMLESAGFEVTVAEHGMEALRLVGQQRFDVVLMDWQMPGMDGLEVTRRMRLGDAGAWGRQVPVVALTANAFIEDRDACLAVGMDDFLSKPVVVPELLATLRRWVHKGHARARGETESPTRYSTLS